LAARKARTCTARLLYHSYECNASSAFWREVIVFCVVAMATCVTSGRIDLCSYVFAVLAGAVLSRSGISATEWRIPPTLVACVVRRRKTKNTDSVSV
jgi:ABC-type enterobactin transport system permease subunit